MFALYGSGIIVERDIGSVKYFMTFIFSGLIAGITHCFLYPSSDMSLIGSSGAIFGIIAVLFLLMPFKISFTLIIPLPSIVLGLLLIAIELSAFWMASDVGIAHDAHIAGFIFGGFCAFIIDFKRAFKGVVIAIAILIFIYLFGLYFDVLAIPFS
jgi:membrane associated rhomboid family serine protease